MDERAVSGYDSELMKRVEFIRGHFIEFGKKVLDMGDKYIDAELSSFLLLPVKPVVKMFYTFYKKNRLEKTVFKQLDVMLEAAIYAVTHPEVPTEKVVEIYRNRYLMYDPVMFLNRNHRNYTRCVDSTLKLFKLQLDDLVRLLKYEGTVTSYKDNVIKAFGSRSTVLECLGRQYEAMREGLLAIGEDVSILDAPVGKDIIYRVLYSSHEDVWNGIMEDVKNWPFPSD